MLKNNKFNFTGEGAQYFGILIANFFLCIFTLGFYIPWAIVKSVKYNFENTTFSGKPFSYTGKGMDIFKGFLIFVGAMVVYVLLAQLSPVLSGIFYLALVFGGLPYAMHAGLTYDAKNTHWNGYTFEFKADFMEYFKMFVTNLLLIVVTIGIYTAWGSIAIKKYTLQHLKIGRLTFDFEGEGMALFMIMLKGLFLTMITFGIYGFWFVKELNHYNTNNLVIFQDGRKCNFHSDLKVGDVFNMMFVGMLLVMITFGIALAWVEMRNMRIMLTAIEISDDLDPENIG